MSDDYYQEFTVEELEQRHACTFPPFSKDDPVPFGFANNQWQQLLDMMQEGDELYEFRTGKESWRQLCGRAGVQLVRDGIPIATMYTEIS